MVKKMIPVIACDVGGEDGAKEMILKFDGKVYKADLCAKHAKPLLDWAVKYADVSQEPSNVRLTGLDKLLATSKKDKDKP